MHRILIDTLLALSLCSFWASSAFSDALPLSTPDPFDIEYPDDEEPTKAEIELGKMLFFDQRLSEDQTISCASCHEPEIGLGDGLKTSVGIRKSILKRNSPHLYNLAWNVSFFWDGRVSTLEEQVLEPIEDQNEMDMNLESLVSRLRSIPGYVRIFQEVYGKKITKEGIAYSLASFLRSLQSTDSPFDRYMKGETDAISPAAIRGKKLFEGKARCLQCHDGANLTDNSFHNLGMEDEDLGRGPVVRDSTLNGAFKTPGLRNVLLSAPYMHDGSLGTLEEVLEFYNRGGGPSKNKSPLLRPLSLTKTEIVDLMAFLGALTDPVPIEIPTLPPSEEIFQISPGNQ